MLFDKTAKSLKVARGSKKTDNPQQLAEIPFASELGTLILVNRE